MRYLFVSSEKVSRDQYRHGPIFRLAGVLLLLGLVLQAPLFFLGVLSLKQFEDRNAEQASLRIERGELQKADIPLRETRQKIGADSAVGTDKRRREDRLPERNNGICTLLTASH